MIRYLHKLRGAAFKHFQACGSMVLIVYLCFGFCAHRAQKPKHKKIKHRSAEGWIADCLSRVTYGCRTLRNL